MKQYDSISDLLVAHGYTIDPAEQRFSKQLDYASIEIPFSALAGHSVSTFYQKARQKGWIEAEGSGLLNIPGLAVTSDFGVIAGSATHTDLDPDMLALQHEAELFAQTLLQMSPDFRSTLDTIIAGAIDEMRKETK